MLTLNPRARCSVGVQLGADWGVVVLTDAGGTVLARTRVHGARSTNPDEVIGELAAHVDAALVLQKTLSPRQLVGG